MNAKINQLIIGLCLCCLLLAVNSCKQSPKRNAAITSGKHQQKYTGALAKHAMVVSAHPEASRVGVEVLKAGGNAFDASVAVQFALAVVYPRAGNLGGGGFMILRTKDGKINTLDFREEAPAKAHKDMYLDKEGNVIPNLSLDGHLAVGIPGTVAGMVQTHEKYGTMPFADLVQPAIDLATKGYQLSEVEAEKMNTFQEDFKRLNTQQPVFVNTSANGKWKAGDIIKQTDLAKTLQLIQQHKAAGFYEGTTANNIVAEMKRGNGIISLADLKNYKAKWRKPITGQYKDYRIISMPPPSSGGIALLQLCEMVEDYPLQKWGFQNPKTVHCMVEAERRVYADRAKHLGDMDFYPVPINGLLDDAYIRSRMDNFDANKASKTAEVAAGAPKGAVPESEETTHYSIVDQEGNAVSVTTTLNANFGSKVVVGGSGFLLNNEMDDFSAKPGVPNLYGLVGAKANAIAPGKRMLSSMTPTIVEKDNRLLMVLGTPGGSTIITSVFQTFINVVEFDMSMQEAVNNLRFHHQWKPDTVYVERDEVTNELTFNEQQQKQLEELGHTIVERKSIGRVDAILVRSDGQLEGAGDIRGEDTSLGF